MSRLLLTVISIAAMSLGLTACGGTKSSGTTPIVATGGKAVFTAAGCGKCHTLAAADATGTSGPNLDDLGPTKAAVIKQVTNGGGGMPSFGGQLTAAQIEALAQFVSK